MYECLPEIPTHPSTRSIAEKSIKAGGSEPLVCDAADLHFGIFIRFLVSVYPRLNLFDRAAESKSELFVAIFKDLRPQSLQEFEAVYIFVLV